MFGAFKKLFAKLAGSPPASAPATEEPAHATAPAPIPSAPSAPAPAPKPDVPSPAPVRVATPQGDLIALPLNEILLRLPTPLSAMVLSRPGGVFSISVDLAVEQLRTGAVRISFAELRQASPAGTFTDNAAQDDSLVD
jgi:hypothetical protein